MFLSGWTDGQTDTRSTQNYSSEPHKTHKTQMCFRKIILKHIIYSKLICVLKPIKRQKPFQSMNRKIKKSTLYC